MIDKPKVTRNGAMVIGEYEPGNGARYTAVAVPWQGPGFALGGLGNVSDGWLVIAGNSGRAHLFQKTGFLTDDYIREKLEGRSLGLCDFPEFGDLIRFMIARPSEVAPHRDLDTIDLEHDLGTKWLTDPFEGGN